MRSTRAARINLSRTWDVATIGVRRDAGASRLFAAAALYHGIALAAQVNRIQTIVMILDERARRLLTGLGVMTQPLPGTHAPPYPRPPDGHPLHVQLGHDAGPEPGDDRAHRDDQHYVAGVVREEPRDDTAKLHAEGIGRLIQRVTATASAR